MITPLQFLLTNWQSALVIASSGAIAMAATWVLACFCAARKADGRAEMAYAEGNEIGYRRGRLEGYNQGFWRGKDAGEVAMARRYAEIAIDATNLRTVNELMKQN